MWLSVLIEQSVWTLNLASTPLVDLASTPLVDLASKPFLLASVRLSCHWNLPVKIACQDFVVVLCF